MKASVKEQHSKTVVEETKPATFLTIKKPVKKLTYLFAVGRRKTAIARVRLHQKDHKTDFIVNGKNYLDYFKVPEFIKIVEEPLKLVNLFNKIHLTVKVKGGGSHSQAEAVRHGISRILVKDDEELRKTLRANGFLTRDPREKERKKPGLKRARRAPQFSKR